MHGEPVVIEGSELLARAIQHETDHLDGILFVDRLDRETRKAAMKAIREAEWFGGRRRTVKVVAARRPSASGSERAASSSPAPPRSALPVAATRSRASRHELVGVVTRPDAPAGRGRRLVASPVAERRRGARRTRCSSREHPRDPEFQDALRALAPDCCPVVAYGALLPQSALDIPEHGWVNLHFSVLPAWRGAAPVQHAIWAGDEVTGATTFRIVKELDAGPTYGADDRDDPARRHRRRPARRGWPRAAPGCSCTTLDGIEDGTLEAREQPAEGVSLAPKITVEDARVDWTEPAVAVDRRIRACTPAPGRLDRRSPASGSSSDRCSRSSATGSRPACSR